MRNVTLKNNREVIRGEGKIKGKVEAIFCRTLLLLLLIFSDFFSLDHKIGG